MNRYFKCLDSLAIENECAITILRLCKKKKNAQLSSVQESSKTHEVLVYAGFLEQEQHWHVIHRIKKNRESVLSLCHLLLDHC